MHARSELRAPVSRLGIGLPARWSRNRSPLSVLVPQKGTSQLSGVPSSWYNDVSRPVLNRVGLEAFEPPSAEQITRSKTFSHFSDFPDEQEYSVLAILTSLKILWRWAMIMCDLACMADILRTQAGSFGSVIGSLFNTD